MGHDTALWANLLPNASCDGLVAELSKDDIICQVETREIYNSRRRMPRKLEPVPV